MAELQYQCIRELEEGINLQSTILEEGINIQSTVVQLAFKCGLCTHNIAYPQRGFVRYSFSENITIKNSFSELPLFFQLFFRCYLLQLVISKVKNASTYCGSEACSEN